MELQDWLDGLGVSEYLDVFRKEGADCAEDLIGLSAEDLEREYGVTKKIHRKKLLGAIAQLAADTEKGVGVNSNCDDSALVYEIQKWPFAVAMPLHQYFMEDHPGMKLWSACDAVEMFLRFAVISMTADLQQAGKLDGDILKDLCGYIEMPTLGAWLVMAHSLAVAKLQTELVIPEMRDYVVETLAPLLYGNEKPGTAETSFLRLRNRLAHGGGMTRAEATRLLSLWQDPFEAAIGKASWLADLRVVGCSTDRLLFGLNGYSEAVDADDISQKISGFQLKPGSIWVLRNSRSLPLWPMATFAKPICAQSVRVGDRDIPQIYMRKDVVRLQFTPMGTEGFCQSEGEESTLQAFLQLFDLDKSPRLTERPRFKVTGFEKEIRRDANQMVGRTEDLKHVRSWVCEREQGLVWLTGGAGMGKSYLVAKLAADLMEEHKESDTIVLTYRFKAGDNMRCRRDAFADYVQERLEAACVLQECVATSELAKAEDRLEDVLGSILLGKRVILILDGLDEICQKDPSFAEDIPCKLRYPRLLWLCAGRPEHDLMEKMRIYQAELPYTEGLPPMSGSDIRGMILEKVGPLKRTLIKHDKEKGDTVINPFIDLVEKRAEGLPLYVKYVIGDVLAGRYRVLDGQEYLPASLQAYHEELLQRLGVGDLQSIVTPLTATLAVAYEPLAEHEIAYFFRNRKILPAGELGDELLRRGLGAIAGMIRTASDPDGEEGYTLFHKSLREHILLAETMRGNVQTCREAFAEAAQDPHIHAGIANYLYRCGVDHLLDSGLEAQAQEKLLDLEYLCKLRKLGKQEMDIFRYWRRMGDEDRSTLYRRIVATTLDKPHHAEQLQAIRFIGSLCRKGGWFHDLTIIANIMVQSHVRLFGEESPDTIYAGIIATEIFLAIGEYGDARKMIREQLDSLARVKDIVLGLNLHSERLHGVCLNRMGDYKAAEDILAKTVRLCREFYGLEHSSTITAISDYASVIKAQGRYDDAYSLLSIVLEWKTKNCGDFHPDTLFVTSNIAGVHRAKGEYDKALALLEIVYERRKNVLGEWHPETVWSLNTLAGIHQAMKHFGRAKPMRLQALRMNIKILGLKHPHTLFGMSAYASLLTKLGELRKAKILAARAFDLRCESLGRDHPETLFSECQLGRIYNDMGKNDIAVAMFVSCLRLREQRLGMNHPDTRYVRRLYEKCINAKQFCD